jgi:hypothetical protein
MSNLSFQVTLSLNPFSSDDFEMLDETLDEFITQALSTKAFSSKPKLREVNIIQPQFMLYPPSNKLQTINKHILILQHPKNNVLQ